MHPRPLQSYGWTPLYFAADTGSTECVRILLAAGADKEVVEWKARVLAPFRLIPSVSDLVYLTFVSPLSLRSSLDFSVFYRFDLTIHAKSHVVLLAAV